MQLQQVTSNTSNLSLTALYDKILTSMKYRTSEVPTHFLFPYNTPN